MEGIIHFENHGYYEKDSISKMGKII